MSFARRLRRQKSLALESLERRECLTATVDQVANINTMIPFVEVAIQVAAMGSYFYLMAAQKDSPLAVVANRRSTKARLRLAIFRSRLLSRWPTLMAQSTLQVRPPDWPIALAYRWHGGRYALGEGSNPGSGSTETEISSRWKTCFTSAMAATCM